MNLFASVKELLAKHAGSLKWPTFRDGLAQVADDATDFIRAFEDLNDRFLDIAYDQERLHDQPEPLLRNVVELSHRPRQSTGDRPAPGDSALALEQRLLNAVGLERH